MTKISDYAGLAGWRAEEIELIAALVRYHRKSLPKPVHIEWLAASPEVREKIMGLGGMLRLADGLDRRHLGVVASVEPRLEPGLLRLMVEAQQDVSSELDGALFKADLFEKAFGLRVAVEALPRKAYASSFNDGDASAAEMDAASLSV